MLWAHTLAHVLSNSGPKGGRSEKAQMKNLQTMTGYNQSYFAVVVVLFVCFFYILLIQCFYLNSLHLCSLVSPNGI